MSETLRTRVTRIVAGSVHAMLDKLEDAQPVAMLEQAVREVEQVTADVRAEMGRVIASRHLAQQQHVRLNGEFEQLAAQSQQALAQQREDLARAAIARQIDIEAQLPLLESSLSELTQQERELAGYIDALQGKQREMQAAIAQLRSAQQAVQTPTAGAARSSTAQQRVGAAEAAFDRVYQRQGGISALAGSPNLQQASQLRELQDLVRDNKISERLAALKAQQGGA